MVRELIYRIEYEIEEHPKCPVCGKLLEFYKREWKYKSFCSKQCKNSFWVCVFTILVVIW